MNTSFPPASIVLFQDGHGQNKEIIKNVINIYKEIKMPATIGSFSINVIILAYIKNHTFRLLEILNYSIVRSGYHYVCVVDNQSAYVASLYLKKQFAIIQSTYDGGEIALRIESLYTRLESNKQPCNHARTHQMGWQRSSTESWSRPWVSVNHALATWFWLINQTWVTVFLGIKNTEVRAYRTDPVQVRSCFSIPLFFIYAFFHLKS
ncbi:hypothetical protein Ccrd_003746 [Cynara cardunculus var. scolymus]|uniref:Uncharacterized protein n=1 Tax=Cynara cardunculus var. scolymus TaxID=59895 RepID=A0A103XNW7_CYNCS|nr:hypothetical protein Ccrd_003746 [Cynara cardunculus var. scolymus]